MTESPIQVGFFLAENASMSSILNVVEVFRAANRVTGAILFDQKFLTVDGGPVETSAGFKIDAQGRIAEAKPFDVVVVVASYELSPNHRNVFLGALKRQARHGAMIWGIDTGVIWVIEAGLVGSRCIAPHWEHVGVIREHWPDIEITDGLYRLDDNLATSGGQTACIDLTLFFVQQRFGEELAHVVAKEILYSGIRSPQTLQPNAAVSSWKDHRLLKEALKIMEENIESPVPILEIAERIGVTCRQLEYLTNRHFKETPTHRYTKVRLNRARELLLYSEYRITDIALACGFSSVSSFSRCFRRHLEINPKDYRARFIGERVRPFFKVDKGQT